MLALIYLVLLPLLAIVNAQVVSIPGPYTFIDCSSGMPVNTGPSASSRLAIPLFDAPNPAFTLPQNISVVFDAQKQDMVVSRFINATGFHVYSLASLAIHRGLPGGTFSFSVWVKMIHTAVNDWILVAVQANTNIFEATDEISVTNNNPFMQLFVALGSVSSSVIPTVNQWSHIVGSLNNATGILKLYLNGSLVGTATGARGAPYNPNTVLYFGASQFSGLIYQPAVFDYELNSTQVSALYTGNYAFTYPPPAAPVQVPITPIQKPFTWIDFASGAPVNLGTGNGTNVASFTANVAGTATIDVEYDATVKSNVAIRRLPAGQTAGSSASVAVARGVPNGTYTISVWVKLTHLTTLDYIFVNSDPINGATVTSVIDNVGGNTPASVNFLGTTVLDPSWMNDVPPALNQWTHLAGSMNNATGVIKMYMNGMLLQTSSGDQTPVMNKDAVLNFGYNAFNGSIWQPMVFDYELTEDQMMALYTGNYFFYTGTGTAMPSPFTNIDFSTGNAVNTGKAGAVNPVTLTTSVSNGNIDIEYDAIMKANVAVRRVTANQSANAAASIQVNRGIPNGTYTFSVWVKMSHVSTADYVMLSVDPINGVSVENKAFEAAGVAGISFFPTDNGPVVFLQGIPPTPDQWTHLAGSMSNTTGVVKMYSNGQLVSSGTALATPTFDASELLYFGYNAFNGSIYQPMTFDYELTPSQVLALYSNTFIFYTPPIISSTVAPTTAAPTTAAPTTAAPTTVALTTVAPTTVAPTTVAPTTVAPTTVAATTQPATTVTPTTVASTTVAPTTVAPTTVAPTTVAPTTASPTTASTAPPTTVAPTTVAATTAAASTTAPTTITASTATPTTITPTTVTPTTLPPIINVTMPNPFTLIDFSSGVAVNMGKAGAVDAVTLTGPASNANIDVEYDAIMKANVAVRRVAVNQSANAAASIQVNRGIPNGTYTFSVWVKMSHVSTADYVMISIDSFDGVSVSNKAFEAAGSGGISFFPTDNGPAVFLQSTPPIPSQWTHLAGSMSNTTGVVKMYSNGLLVSSGTALATPIFDYNEKLYFGYNAFNGSIYQPMVFDYELNATQMWALYNGHASFTTTPTAPPTPPATTLPPTTPVATTAAATTPVATTPVATTATATTATATTATATTATATTDIPTTAVATTTATPEVHTLTASLVVNVPPSVETAILTHNTTAIQEATQLMTTVIAATLDIDPSLVTNVTITLLVNATAQQTASDHRRMRIMTTTVVSNSYLVTFTVLASSAADVANITTTLVTVANDIQAGTSSLVTLLAASGYTVDTTSGITILSIVGGPLDSSNSDIWGMNAFGYISVFTLLGLVAFVVAVVMLCMAMQHCDKKMFSTYSGMKPKQRT